MANKAACMLFTVRMCTVHRTAAIHCARPIKLLAFDRGHHKG